MDAEPSASTSDADRSAILEQCRGRTSMVVGAAGTGKSMSARWLATQLAAQTGPVALVSADMGQQHVGVPTCLGLSLSEPWDQAAALWFIGTVSPSGNLLPSVVGTAKLVGRARAEGAQSVVIDTTGLVDPPAGGVLKYHKVLAAGVDCLVAIQRAGELEPMLSSLTTLCPLLHRIAAPTEARERGPAERRAYREQQYAAYFQNAKVMPLPASALIGHDWMVRPSGGESPPAGTLVGLLDQQGFCLGLGILEEAQAEWLALYTPWKRVKAVARVRLGRTRLDRQAHFAETSWGVPQPQVAQALST